MSFFGGIAIAIAVYSWWWNGQLDVVAAKYDVAFSQIFPEGTIVSYSLQDSGGYPFRINHKLADISIRMPGYGSFRFEAIELVHQPWTNGHMVLHFEGAVERFDNKGAAIWTLHAGKNLASLVGYDGNRVSYDLDMRDVSLNSNEGQVDVPELQYHARTQGRFGDSSTEVSIVTKFEGLPNLF